MIDKVQACFLGLAVGDALGVPVEFRAGVLLVSRKNSSTACVGSGMPPSMLINNN
ncbi:MAG TPA: ADP-ribosylglycohydrolase family protein [Ohtaekwangia sp.]|nr:ADP-ribosylglycohydrolase family protein [Ohtaekwangia sp.]